MTMDTSRTDTARPVDSLVFPFGEPVLRCRPASSTTRYLWILGAYPSALHVAWRPPHERHWVRALPVDNEPEPFWNGLDAEERIERWKDRVRYVAQWGEIRPPGNLNGR